MAKYSKPQEGKFSVQKGDQRLRTKYIAVPSDFPTKAEADAYIWDFYILIATVTDNDPTKTNTGQSGIAGEEWIWNLTNYTKLGADALWGDDLTDLSPINPRNINLKANGLRDNNVITAIKLGDSLNTSFNTTNKTIAGSTNENFDKLEITNGHILETISLTITSSGTVITANLSAAVGTDLHFVFSDGIQTVDVTSPMTATLTAGSDTSPQENWLYVLKSNPAVLVVSATDFPSDTTTEYAPIGRIIVQSAATVLADGVLKQHNYTDHVKATGGIGHLHDITEWIREQWATWISGIAQTVTGGGTATVTYAVSSGIIRQLHSQAFPAFINPATIYVINDSVTPYTKVTNIGGGILLDSLGGTLNNRYYNLIVWGVCSKDGSGESKLFINLPSGSYATQPSAESDAAHLTNYGIPPKYKGTGFLIQRILFRNNASTTYTVVNTEDLRGQFPNTVAGTSVAVGAQFPDNVFEVFNNADNTKAIVLDASNIATGNTRVIVAPDRDLDLANPDFDTVNTNVVNELTGGNGVDIDGVLHKDGSETIGFFPSQLFFGPAASAPAGWYHLNSSAGTNVIDSSGFGVDLTTVNMVDGDWVAGLLNNCLQFAATKYAQASFQTDLSFDNTNAFSFEFWVNNSNTTSQIILSKMSQTAPNRGYQIVQNVTTGTINFSLRNNVATNQISVQGNIGIADGTWNHVAVTYDGSSTAAGVKIYVNSILNTHTILSDTLTATTITATKFQLSGRDTTTLNYLGKIDEVVIHPRVIDQTFINQRYNGGAGTEVIPGFLNRGSLNVNSITGKMTQLYGGDFELICSAGGSKILLTPPSDGGVEVTDGEYFKWMVGTTAQRPGSPANGMVRYNSDTTRNEFYENGAWENYLTESLENLWDRSGTDLSPHNSGDDVDLGSGEYRGVGANLSYIIYSGGTLSVQGISVQSTANSFIMTRGPTSLVVDGSTASAIDQDVRTSGSPTFAALNIIGKLTVGGLIDPTALVLDPQSSAPATANGTIYYNDAGATHYYDFRVNARDIALSSPAANQISITTGTSVLTATTTSTINQELASGYPAGPAFRKISLTDNIPLNGLSVVLPTLGATQEAGMGTDIYNKFTVNNPGGAAISSAYDIELAIDADNNSTVQEFRITKDAVPFSSGTLLFKVSEDGTTTTDNINLTNTAPTNGLTISLDFPTATNETGIGANLGNKFIYNNPEGIGIYSSHNIMLMLDSNSSSTTAEFGIYRDANTYAGGTKLFSITENAAATLKAPSGISGSTSLFTIDTTDANDQSMLEFSKAGVRQWQMTSRNQLDTPNDRLSIYDNVAAGSNEVISISQGNGSYAGTVAINTNLAVKLKILTDVAYTAQNETLFSCITNTSNRIVTIPTPAAGNLGRMYWLHNSYGSTFNYSFSDGIVTYTATPGQMITMFSNGIAWAARVF